jgi:hypothetical protein
VVFVACVQAWRKTRACDHEGDAGATAGFQRVLGAFVATSTAQLAAGLSEIHIFSTGVPVMCSSSPSFPFLHSTAP